MRAFGPVGGRTGVTVHRHPLLWFCSADALPNAREHYQSADHGLQKARTDAADALRAWEDAKAEFALYEAFCKTPKKP